MKPTLAQKRAYWMNVLDTLPPGSVVRADKDLIPVGADIARLRLNLIVARDREAAPAYRWEKLEHWHLFLRPPPLGAPQEWWDRFARLLKPRYRLVRRV